MNQEKIRNILLKDISRLLGRSDRIDAHWRKKPPNDWEELAIFRENDEVINYLDERTHEQLNASIHAITRMETGDWENCTRCGEYIGSARLETLPTTTLCVGCAILAERTTAK